MADETRAALKGRVTITPKADYLRVTMLRSAQTVAEFLAIRDAVEGAMLQHRLEWILFDVSKADRASDDVRPKIWEWLTTSPTLKRVAFLVESEMLAITVNMTGVKSGKPLRAFAAVDFAESWLRLGKRADA